MPIKQPATILTPEDFTQALHQLRLSVSEVAKATGIPRTYCSEFRTGDRKLKPELLAKLRDFFETKGVEFSDQDSPGLDDPQPDEQEPPHPALGCMRATQLFIPIPASVDPQQVARAMGGIEQATDELKAMLNNPVEYEAGFFATMLSDGTAEYTEEFKAKLQQTCALATYGFFCFLFATGAIKADMPTGPDEQPKTLRDVLLASMTKQLMANGLIAPEETLAETPAEDTENEEAEA